MSNYFPLVFFFLLSLNLNTQKSNLLGDKTFNEVQVSLIQMDEGDFNVKLNFLNENDFICNKDALGAIIESLKNADTKKEYSNFFRLKSHNTEIKFLVRHDNIHCIITWNKCVGTEKSTDGRFTSANV